MNRPLVIFWCAFVLLWPAGAGWSADKGTVVEMMSLDFEKSLGLTPEQKAKVAVVREAYKDRRRLLRKELDARYENLRLELDAASVSPEKVGAAAAQVKALQGQLLDNRVDVVIKLRAIYTPEQLRKIRDGVSGVVSADKPVQKGVKKVRKLEKRK
ncbi:MAG: Spy/CpxP family protein refolding chaperone [Candidatus Omnitrophota bacterium]